MPNESKYSVHGSYGFDTQRSIRWEEFKTCKVKLCTGNLHITFEHIELRSKTFTRSNQENGEGCSLLKSGTWVSLAVQWCWKKCTCLPDLPLC